MKNDHLVKDETMVTTIAIRAYLLEVIGCNVVNKVDTMDNIKIQKYDNYDDHIAGSFLNRLMLQTQNIDINHNNAIS